MERVGPCVPGNLPTLRHPRHGMQIVRVFRDQSLKQGGNDVVLRHTRHDLRVHVLRFGAVAVKENLLAVAITDARRWTRATVEEGSDNRDGNRRRQMPNDETRTTKQSHSLELQTTRQVNSDFEVDHAFG